MDEVDEELSEEKDDTLESDPVEAIEEVMEGDSVGVMVWLEVLLSWQVSMSERGCFRVDQHYCKGRMTMEPHQAVRSIFR